MKNWEVVIGLEIHAQLATNTKIFSAASTAFASLPNTQACPIDLGMPGMLPVLNKQAVEMAVKFGLAVEADIAPVSVFARKNYFYPDLPKGYQISQFELPIVGTGKVILDLEDGEQKEIGITRAHLEEDAGKSLHESFEGESGIDLNRAGIPLLEIVSEPDMRSTKEAVLYAKKIHAIVRYLDICDGNMQEGSFRIDANISLRRFGDPLGTRAELKNINSFRFLEKALLFEIGRQTDILESGGSVLQETRLYDANRDETRSMRGKEEANDYRYFPDPDLLPVVLDEPTISRIQAGLPELPNARCARFVRDYGLTAYDAEVLTATKVMAEWFEQVVQSSGADAKMCANWLMGDISALLNKDALPLEEAPITVEQLSQLIKRVVDKTISGKIAKEVLDTLWQEGGEVDAIIERKGLRQITDDSAITAIIKEVIQNNPNQVSEYRSGKDKLFGFFVGQVMKATQGKANPAQVNTLLRKHLS